MNMDPSSDTKPASFKRRIGLVGIGVSDRPFEKTYGTKKDIRYSLDWILESLTFRVARPSRLALLAFFLFLLLPLKILQILPSLVD